MAGHSKWANIKYRKERSDKKKGKIFNRIMKEIISAVKQGGTDPKTNHKLRIAIDKARVNNVPSENIERNIKKASSDTREYLEMVYELYGYGGVGIIVEVMTDNKNKTAADMHIATNKCGGTIATPGAVSYNFDRKGIIRVPKSAIAEDTLFLLVSEYGAEDFALEPEAYRITTSPEAFYTVKNAIEKAGIRCEEAEIVMEPKTWVEVSDEHADANMTLIEWLENLEEVDTVYHNMLLA